MKTRTATISTSRCQGSRGESLDVQVENNQLTVAAERQGPEWPRETEVHITGRSYGHFRCAFRLPPNAAPDGIRAAYTDGVLELTVDQRPESKPVKVQVN